MANQEFIHKSGEGKFAYFGVNTHRPPDLMPQGKCPFMLNVATDLKDGTAQSRPGTSLLATSSVVSPVHSIKRMNDNTNLVIPYGRYVGVGTSLYEQNPATGGSAVAKAGGFSGNPLSLIPFRPPNAPNPFLYVYDSAKLAKLDIEGNEFTQGIRPPIHPPLAGTANPQYDSLAFTTGFSGSGGASNTVAATRVNTTPTVLALVFDNDFGTPDLGWCGVVIDNGASTDVGWIGGVGAQFLVGTERITVEQGFSTPHGLTTVVESVEYDVGVTGECCIQPVRTIPSLVRNQVLLIGAEYVRILSVSGGPNSNGSFRCKTTGTVVAGQTIALPLMFRTYFYNAHLVGEAITGGCVESTLTGSGVALLQVGAPFAPVSGLGLQVPSGQASSDDYLHWSFRANLPQNITEIHFLFDVDSQVNDFTRNYYYIVFRQGDFTGLVEGSSDSVTSELFAAQTDIVGQYKTNNAPSPVTPYPGSYAQSDGAPGSSQQLTPSNNVWFEAMWKLVDMIRVGNDPSVSYNLVKALGIRIFYTDDVVVQFGGLWFGGSGGPDCNYNSYGNQGEPIQYRYRYRDTRTGARSDQSPATRNGELTHRTAINLQLQGSPNPAVDVIDVERRGGTFNEWKQVATFGNPGDVPLIVYDNTLEAIASSGQALELKQYVPFPTLDLPHSGTCRVAGTTVTRLTGDVFSQNWLKGTEIIINGNTYSLYSVNTPNQLELQENVGTFASAIFSIPEAVSMGQPLPYADGPWDGRMWACGSRTNPGLAYFTNSDTADSADEAGYIEVTSPSEPLIGVSIYDGTIYFHSTQNIYRIEASNIGSANPYSAYRVSGSYGIDSPWFKDFHGIIGYYGGFDGIYQFTLGGSKLLSWGDLKPLFPSEDNAVGVPVTFGPYTLYPVDFTQSARLRLYNIDNIVYFDYVDINGVSMCLLYNPLTDSWQPYLYGFGSTMHYQEDGINNPLTLVGGLDGNLHEIGDFTDDSGSVFNSVIATPSLDQGETRSRKQYGDVMLDYQTNTTLNTQLYADNYLVVLGASTPGATTRNQINLLTPNDNNAIHRNISAIFSWLSTSGTILYEWSPSFIVLPDDTTLRVTDWNDGGSLNNKWVQGLRIDANTFNAPKQYRIEYDGGIVGPTITIGPSTAEQIFPFSFPPFKAHLMRLVPLDSTDIEVFRVQWVFNIEPEQTGFWVTQPTSMGIDGYGHSREAQLAYASLGAATFSVVVGGVVYVLYQDLVGTAGVMVKKYVPTPPIKSKLWQLSYTGTGLQVYEKDCEFRVKQWGVPAPYNSFRITGDLNMTEGARI